MKQTGLSKRSLALTMVGVFFILQGVTVGANPLFPPDHAILHETIPVGVRAVLWITTGTITAVWAWMHAWQWVAVVAAVVMPIERTVSYVWSFAHWLIPGPPGGSAWSIVDAAQWAALVALIVVIGGWIEWDRAGGEEHS